MDKLPETVLADGVHGQFLTFADDLITRQIVKFGAHTRNEIAMVLDHIEAGATCVDLGAHIGTFAIAIAGKIGPQGRVLAVEGAAATMALLRHNIEANGLQDRITSTQAIAADGTLRRLSRHEVTGNSGAGHFAPEIEAAPIQTQDTSDLLKTHGFDSPDFIKIDIEGMEAIALRNLAPILVECRPVLYFEIAAHSLARFGDTPDMIQELLSDLGYKFFRNAGARNSHNDRYHLEALDTFLRADRVFDVLALPPSHG